MTKSIDPIDRHVGARIRMQRLVSGMSQTTLGDKAGITFQQDLEIRKRQELRQRRPASTVRKRLQGAAGILLRRSIGKGSW